jgi:Chemoreceptor zinc-binding domain
MSASSFQVQVSAAITAHGLWKTHLFSAVALGETPFKLDEVARDDRCRFGQWLHGLGEERKSPHFERVRGLHARFHGEAARVLELATSGEGDAARRSLERGGAYQRASAELVGALGRWVGEAA